MAEIVPGILARTPEQLYADLRRLEPHTSRVHIDIIDGHFAPNTTVNGYDELAAFDTLLKFDIHLMVNEPAAVLERWYGIKNAERFFVHAEAVGDVSQALAHAHEKQRWIGVALNPETDGAAAERFLANADGVLLLGVHPGFSGQKMLPGTVEKVAALRANHPELFIGVDGGIDLETALQAKGAGATMLVSTSYILRSPDIAAAIKNLNI